MSTFKAGDRVQLTGPKGRLNTITLVEGARFGTHKGDLMHDDIIGLPDGSVIANQSGVEYLALKPLLTDYVLSMPRGAAIVYPKDAGQIIVADPLESRRAMSVDLGATGTIDVTAGDTAEQLRAIQPQGVHCVLDTSGAVPAIHSGIAALAPLGRLAMVGVPKALDAAISLNILHMLSLGISICGVTEGNADPQTFLPELVTLNAKGLFPFEKLITRYRLEDINQAVADQHAGRCVKAVLTMT